MKNLVNIIHWVAVGSGFAVSLFTALSSSGELSHAAWVGVALSASQVVHKFVDALDHKETLDKAITSAASAIKL